MRPQSGSLPDLDCRVGTNSDTTVSGQQATHFYSCTTGLPGRSLYLHVRVPLPCSAQLQGRPGSDPCHLQKKTTTLIRQVARHTCQ